MKRPSLIKVWGQVNENAWLDSLRRNKRCSNVFKGIYWITNESICPFIFLSLLLQRFMKRSKRAKIDQGILEYLDILEEVE